MVLQTDPRRFLPGIDPYDYNFRTHSLQWMNVAHYRTPLYYIRTDRCLQSALYTVVGTDSRTDQLVLIYRTTYSGKPMHQYWSKSKGPCFANYRSRCRRMY
uniref:Uncharacterized protein n=1 Tax=Cacopsylla melanoneura TaxID=428564 RepID=A0A8D9FIN8_9HEMI